MRGCVTSRPPVSSQHLPGGSRWLTFSASATAMRRSLVYVAPPAWVVVKDAWVEKGSASSESPARRMTGLRQHNMSESTVLGVEAWHELWAALGGSASDDLRTQILTSYDEPHRAY